MFDITPIVQCVFIVLVILGTAYGLPVLKFFKVLNFIKIAVEAAEQLFPESGMGAEKKNYVLKWLNDRGITYDAGIIDAMIESAVHKLNQKQDEKVVYVGYPDEMNYGETEGTCDDTECSLDEADDEISAEDDTVNEEPVSNGE